MTKIKITMDESYDLPLWTFDLPKLEQRTYRWWHIEPEKDIAYSWVFDPLDYTLEPEELNDLEGETVELDTVPF